MGGMSKVDIKLELSGGDLSDLQQHMARLIQYYETDLGSLGRMEAYAAGVGLTALRELIQTRLEQLDSAERLAELLSRY